MSYAPTPAAAGNGHRVALLGIGLLGAALFALVEAGVVAPPDLEGALTDLSETLGAWTTPASTSANSVAPSSPRAISAVRCPPMRSGSAGA